jgi:hypothetical protein
MLLLLLLLLEVLRGGGAAHRCAPQQAMHLQQGGSPMWVAWKTGRHVSRVLSGSAHHRGTSWLQETIMHTQAGS